MRSSAMPEPKRRATPHHRQVLLFLTKEDLAMEHA
jgi:hypothetical protein